jgi:hypothetical protein
MSERIKVDRPLIESLYSQDEPNQPIELGQVAIQFDCQDVSYHKTATAIMRFLPKDSLEFVVPLEGEDSWLGMKLFQGGDPSIRLTLTDRTVTFDAFLSATGGKHGGLVFCPTQSGITVTQPSAAISTATFHLFNFPAFLGPENYILKTGSPPLRGFTTCGRAVLKADGWIITIAATDRTDDLEEELKAQGGHVITHVGQIVRENGTTFTSEELDNLLACLHHFLSFALGCWAGVALPVGFDSDGNRVFEQWGMRRSTDGPWNGFCSWFDRHHGELLSQVFPGFTALWNNALWHTPLAHVVYWYLGACRGGVGSGVDAGLILAQTALELLAWNYCVQDRKIVSSEAFKRRNGLCASDKLRLLASFMNIPKEVPSTLSALLHRGPGKKWDDGMDAITGIRNSLVHPDNRLAISGDSYSQAYQFSLWLINLAILRLCGHNGMYANMLAPNRWVGTVEQVPWGQKDKV